MAQIKKEKPESTINYAISAIVHRTYNRELTLSNFISLLTKINDTLEEDEEIFVTGISPYEVSISSVKKTYRKDNKIFVKDEKILNLNQI